MKKTMVIDPYKCTGCCRCESVCSLVKTGAVSVTNARVNVVRYDMEAFFYPVLCLHCETPYCALVCPSGALRKNPDTGIVDLDQEKCVGCKMCLVACPFGAISFVDGKAIKCDLCGGDPTCAKFCESKVFTYGEVDEAAWEKRDKLSRMVLDTMTSNQRTAPGSPTYTYEAKNDK